MTESALRLIFGLLASNVQPIWGRFDHQRATLESTHLWTLLSITALLIATAIVAYRSSQRRKRQFTHDSPRRLFRELCRAHGLPLASRRLLKRVAAARGIPDPTMLFVISSHFDTTSLPENLRPKANEIRALRNQLYG
jgi:hypothetical protein